MVFFSFFVFSFQYNEIPAQDLKCGSETVFFCFSGSSYPHFTVAMDSNSDPVMCKTRITTMHFSRCSFLFTFVCPGSSVHLWEVILQHHSQTSSSLRPGSTNADEILPKFSWDIENAGKWGHDDFDLWSLTSRIESPHRGHSVLNLIKFV